MGVLLFCGPTGVGKTELAKTLSRFLFGHGSDDDRLVRIDCSEFSGYGAGDRLLTGADGNPGKLIERVRQQPFVVVLLDEIEKAADEIFDVLLTLLDEGRLTGRFGRTTDFRSAIIVLTSNLGVRRESSLGFGDEAKPQFERAVLDFFRPEFVNRLDAIVPFEPLARETIRQIARKELDDLGRREGILAAGLKLVFSEAVIDRVADRGFDARLGARPLQRFLEQAVVGPISELLVEHPGLRNRTLAVGFPDSGEAATVTIEG